MRQALHIFKKDVRYLWYEIGVNLALTAAFVYVQVRFLGRPPFGQSAAIAVVNSLLYVFLPLAWWNLIARAVYAERLCGDRQFWLTRPYSWKSLLTAKTLFMLAFITLPMLVAQAAILSGTGFAFYRYVPGLLWSQVLLASVFVLPAFVIASVTSALVQAVFTALTVALLSSVILSSWPLSNTLQDWRGMEWIRISFALAVLVAGALLVTIWQYARRRTGMSRILAALVILVAWLGTVFLPRAPAIALNSWVSGAGTSYPSLRMEFDRARPLPREPDRHRWDSVHIALPLRIAGLPDGTNLDAPSIQGTALLNGAKMPLFDYHLSHSSTGYWIEFPIQNSALDDVLNQPVTLSLLLELTITRITVNFVPIQDKPFQVPNVGWCAFVGGSSQVFCRSPLRGPRAEVLLVPHNIYDGSDNSPYPAEFGLSPITTFSSAPNWVLAKPASLQIAYKELLAHFLQKFEFRDLRLVDFASEPVDVPSR